MSPAPSESFLFSFRSKLESWGGLRFDHFMALALFDPACGYYTAARTRVGYAPDTDFYTASSTGSLFGELVCASCVTLLKGAGLDPARHHFIEIGSETEAGVLAGVTHPFASARTLRLGDTLQFGGECVVFSNELFDAQPCRRFRRRAGSWYEIGVRENAGLLEEVLLPEAVRETWLPAEAPEGWVLDAPRAAAELAGQIAAQPWSGLFLAFDYGKSLAEMLESNPEGTLRAYHQHRQSNHFLERPGEQDLTCHVCWEWLQEALASKAFSGLRLQSQEAFFVHQASEYIGRLVAEEASRASRRKLALMQLLHPEKMGQKFQVLSGIRGRP